MIRLVKKIDQEHAAVQAKSAEFHLAEGDCVQELDCQIPEKTHIKFINQGVSQLLGLWKEWSDDFREAFQKKYGDVAQLLCVEVNKPLIRAAIRFWDPAYRCFVFNRNDLTPTLEEYTVLLRIQNVKHDKIYWKEKKRSDFWKRLDEIARSGLNGKGKAKSGGPIMEEGKNQGDIPWARLYAILKERQQQPQVVDLFALAVYGLIIFPKPSGMIEITLIEFLEQLSGGIDPVPTILAETIRGLSRCRVNGGWFRGCAQLLTVWLQSHFWEGVYPRAMPYLDISMIKEYCKQDWDTKRSKEYWWDRFMNEDWITWKAPWFHADKLMYACGSYSWVPLLGISGITSYAPLLVQRQFGSQLFVPRTSGLDLIDIEYGSPESQKMAGDISRAWKERYFVKVFESENPVTPEYASWRAHRVNSITMLSQPVKVPPPRMQQAQISEVDIVREQCHEVQERWVKEKEELQKQLRDMQLGMDYKDAQLSQLKEQNINASAQICFLQSQPTSSKKRPGVTCPTTDLEEEMLRQKVEYEESIAKREEELRHMSRKLHATRGRANELLQDNSILRVESESLKQRLTQAERENRELNRRIQRNEVVQLHSELRAANEELRTARAQLAKLRESRGRQVQTLNERIQDLENELKTLNEAWTAYTVDKVYRYNDFVHYLKEQSQQIRWAAQDMINSATSLLNEFTHKANPEHLEFIENVRKKCYKMKIFCLNNGRMEMDVVNCQEVEELQNGMRPAEE